jgi:hypothetical protein
MFYEEQKIIAQNIFKRTPIETVFIECETGRKDDESYIVCGEQYVSLEDNLGLYAYIRQTDHIRLEPKDYENYSANVPLRIVIVGKNITDAQNIMLNLVTSFKGQPIVLSQLLTDKDKLFQSENKIKKEVFLQDWCYIGIDCNLYVPFSMSDCQKVIECKTEKKEFKRCDFNI